MVRPPKVRVKALDRGTVSNREGIVHVDPKNEKARHVTVPESLAAKLVARGLGKIIKDKAKGDKDAPPAEGEGDGEGGDSIAARGTLAKEDNPDSLVNVAGRQLESDATGATDTSATTVPHDGNPDGGGREIDLGQGDGEGEGEGGEDAPPVDDQPAEGAAAGAGAAKPAAAKPAAAKATAKQKPARRPAD